MRALPKALARPLATFNGEELYDKILVANRGEIAVRVFNTCKKLGIKTVAVYSEPDAEAVHTRMADEAICVGPAASADSYLRQDRILEAVKATGAQAVHPGYGFLSENPTFSKALADEGVDFIGPDEYAIVCMGDKIESKELAIKAGVNCIPGYMGVIKDTEEAVEISRQIGYPVMIKASAGGGGKGMRIAWDDEGAREGFTLSTEEARSSFGDDRIFIEKYIEEPRHIEIQILADKHGNVVPFPERECSIQRRNQKVIEESPSMLLDDETRVAMGNQAIMLSKAVDYHTAGTVEFLCDKHKNFYFLEMNTRLQVEHPVTEYISGVDLVYQMIRAAKGYALPDELVNGPRPLPINGWAIESRVYAEDPLRGFLPSTGRLMTYKAPEGTPEEGVRCDSGVREGSDISMFYDPMICKLITHGPTRDAALDLMEESLDNYVIRGVNHNAHFLRDVCEDKRFRSGKVTTNYIAEEYPDGFDGVHLNTKGRAEMACIALNMHLTSEASVQSTDGQLPIYKAPIEDHYVISFDGVDHYVHLEDYHTGKCTVTAEVDGVKECTELTCGDADWTMNAPLWVGSISGKQMYAQFMKKLPEGCRMYYKGSEMNVAVRSPVAAELEKFMIPKEEIDVSKMLVSPMPGLLVSVSVEEGDEVQPGQQIAVVEAMKMQNILRAEKKGIVTSVKAKAGENLVLDQIIVEYDN